jgi:iron complex transport system substrate-binding protein
VDLVAWRDEVVLYQQPFAEAGRLFVSPLWQGMPFVRQQRLAAVAPAWSYGGVGSLVLPGAAHDGCLVAVAAAG